MPNAFSCTLFNNFKLRYESCTLPADRSNVCFFLRSTTDHAKKINRYFNSVKLSPMDVSEKVLILNKMGSLLVLLSLTLVTLKKSHH